MGNKREKNLELFELEKKLLQGDLIIIFNWWKGIIRIIGVRMEGADELFSPSLPVSKVPEPNWEQTQATKWEFKDRISFTTLNSRGFLHQRCSFGPETQVRFLLLCLVSFLHSPLSFHYSTPQISTQSPTKETVGSQSKTLMHQLSLTCSNEKRQPRDLARWEQ